MIESSPDYDSQNQKLPFFEDLGRQLAKSPWSRAFVSSIDALAFKKDVEIKHRITPSVVYVTRNEIKNFLSKNKQDKNQYSGVVDTSTMIEKAIELEILDQDLAIHSLVVGVDRIKILRMHSHDMDNGKTTIARFDIQAILSGAVSDGSPNKRLSDERDKLKIALGLPVKKKTAASKYQVALLLGSASSEIDKDIPREEQRLFNDDELDKIMDSAGSMLKLNPLVAVNAFN